MLVFMLIRVPNLGYKKLTFLMGLTPCSAALEIKKAMVDLCEKVDGRRAQ